VLIVLQTPSSKPPSVDDESGTTRTEHQCVSQLHIVREYTTQNNDNDTTAVSQRWTALGSTTVSCMTGLAWDVDYLTGRLLAHVDRNTLVYEDSLPLSPLGLTRYLSEELQRATRDDNGRPFGIQALFVGIAHGNNEAQQHQFCMYTLDPSGGYRNWMTATAIGRASSLVRKQLYLQIHNGRPPANGLVALQACMRALHSAMPLGRDDRFEALLVWHENDDGRMQIGRVDPKQVRDVKAEIIDKQ
jgi:20S proteasome alpha/beta subunit